MWKRKNRKDKTLENSQKIEDISNEQLMLNIYNPTTCRVCRVRDLDIVDYFLIQIYDSQVLDIIKKKGFSVIYFDEDFYICKKIRR